MTISKNCIQIQNLIKRAEEETSRPSGSVLLLAVSKKQPAEAILEAYAQGIEHFGENYLQEGLAKILQLKGYPICWHFIGPIQSNKTKAIASHFNWVHSINRAKIAFLLNEHRTFHYEPLQVCLQINLVDEKTKSGVSPEEAAELAQVVSQLPNLTLRGLMTIPPPNLDHFALFIQLKELMHDLNNQLKLNMDTLSMGMSDDIIPAIKAGSTIVRVGRALFGERV